MLKAVRLKNFRSILDSGWVDIAPITVVIGKNSAGKSSFLRLFPLLKQSLEADTKEPLLWYGRLVDFGGFSDVVSRYGEGDAISVGFRIQGAPVARHGYVMDDGQSVYFYDREALDLFLDKDIEIAASLTLEGQAGAEGTYVKALTISICRDEIAVVGNQYDQITSVRVGNDRIPITGSIKFRSVRNGFFPSITFQGTNDPRTEARFRREGPFIDVITSQMDWLFHGNTKQPTKRNAVRSLRWGAGRNFYSELVRRIPSAGSKIHWPADQTEEPAAITRLRGLVLLRLLPEIIASLNSELVRLASSVKYLEPVRATASRYYRFQELAVDQIDPQGENVPMFLNSLSEFEQNKLQKWMADSLGFSVSARRTGGHTAVYVSEGDDDMALNLADTGFGYSQILPVALQIWKSLQDMQPGPRHGDRSSMLVIEQPELHLHPQFQAALADVFAAAVEGQAQRSDSRLSLLLETHSEHLLNRLGELVQRGRLKSSDVQIVLFEKNSANVATSVRTAKFNEHGVMEDDWPFGFFVPRLD